MEAQVLIVQDEERQLIQKAYRDLLRCFKNNLEEEDKKAIREAYELAVKAHSQQRRKSGEPYILHPIAVAKICLEEIGLGPTAVVCALLHDVVEDTEVTLEDIKVQFGDRIAKMVDGLTKLDHTYNSESPQAENFRKVLRTLVEDVRVVLIKMADRLHNMRTLGSMPIHKQLKIAAETSYIYAPLAHRLGLYNIKTEFQDMCMKILDSENYQEIKGKLSETKGSRESYIEEFIDPLRKHLDEMPYPYEIYGRPKSIYSIWNKIRSKNVPFEEIYDLFAVRIVLDTHIQMEKAACWQAYSIVSDVYTPRHDRLKDWITRPKSNGYESLHITVMGPKGRFVEVQIRSSRMDEIAEKGFAAHWKYKSQIRHNDVYERWLDSVRELLENPEGDAVEFLDDFRSNSLFNEEVFVFTPKGEMKTLPKGATALDFAFSIHSDIGYQCSAIKVNDKIVPMGYQLRNGDQVEVFTNKNQKPNEDWLKMVVTGKARSKIRSVAIEERKKKGQIGKETLERKLSNLKVDFEESVDLLVKSQDLHSPTDLYFAIATEKINPKELLKQFVVKTSKDGNRYLAEKEEETPVKPEGIKKEPRKKDLVKAKLLINGEPGERFEYSFATCCNPVQGDPVFAYLTANAGLKIHRSSCPNAANILTNYGYRVMRAEWTAMTDSYFVTKLNITGIDDGPGVIERLSHNISDLGLNIRSFNIEGNEGYFEAKISLFVQNLDQLHMAIRALKNLNNVSTVSRIE